MTRSSAALLEAKASGATRMRTFRCGLKKAVRCEALADIFREFSVHVGITKHVVTLVANEIVLRHGAANIDDWFHWYTQVWSSLDYMVDPLGLSSKNPLLPHVRDVLADYPDMLSTLQQCADVRCPVMCRQQECNSLAVATVEHYGQFCKRLSNFLTVEITQIQWRHSGKLDKTLDISRMVSTFVLADPEHAKSSANDLREKLSNVDGTSDDEVALIVDLGVQERNRLGPLVSSKERKERWFYVTQSKKHVRMLTDHLLRYSVAMSHVMRSELLDSTFDSAIRRKKWVRSRKPRPFTILPISDLKPSMMYYGYTEINALYGYIHEKEMKEYKQRFKKRKYSNDSEVPEPPTRFSPDKVDFARTIFKDQLPLDGVKSNWKMLGFRTNGIKTCFTFATDSVPVDGVDVLVEKGYTGVPLCEDIDIGTASRGLWHLKQTSGTVRCSSEDMRIVSVDPGIVKPVQWSTLPMHANATDQTVSSCAAFDHLTESTWMRLSGRAASVNWEQRRRSSNTSYGNAINMFSGVMKRTASRHSFSEYVRVNIHTFKERSDELCHRRRSLQAWLSTRRSQSFLSRVANRIASMESRRTRTYSSPAGRLLTEDERNELRQRIRSKKKQKTVVFFGDGEYSHTTRHHVAIPKKSVLHELGTRVPTILIDEYRTSKYCVCGCPLCNENDDPESRVRVHQDGGDCFTLRCEVCDRDELATLNIALASLRALAHQPWPEHLRRPLST